MNRRMIGMLLAFLLAGSVAVAQSGGAIVDAQILDYQNGYLFLTTGDAFKVAPNVSIVEYNTAVPAPAPPRVRQYARVTFNSAGIVTKIELSNTLLPPLGDLGALSHFAIALSTPAPNPDLAQVTGSTCQVQPGKRVSVTFNVEVPPTTRTSDVVYMTTDQSGWNPQAYRLDRVDALHYRTQLKFYSGTILHYLFDRNGSTQSIQRGQNGLEEQPYLLCIGDADAEAVGKTVYHWGDETPNGSLPAPFTMPTPYNPAPFPNLPQPPPRPPQH